MITGERCHFDALTEWDTAGAIWPKRDTLPLSDGVWLGHIIEKCWTKGYKSVMDFIEELNEESGS